MISHRPKPNKIGIINFFAIVLLHISLFFVSIFFILFLIMGSQVCLFGGAIILTVLYLLAILSYKIMKSKRENIKKGKIFFGVFIGATLCFCILSALLIASYIGPNIGLPFGYYGEFNRVEHRLKKISAVTILDYSTHHDLTLEDFGFILQTNAGLNFHLDFYDHKKTYQLFGRADGLAVRTPFSQGWVLYPFRPRGRLESACGKELTNAVDVLEQFDKIAEVIESDRHKVMPEVGWDGVPKNYLWITIPSFPPKSVE